MTLEVRLAQLAAAIGADIKSIIENAGDLSQLSTTDRTSLVAAINEIRAAQANATGIDDDNMSSTSTYSSERITTLINSSIQAIIGASPGALDTLQELAAALGNDENFAANLVVTLSEKVGVNAQTFTAPQQAQARTNIGAASSADLTALTNAVGDTEVDLVALYTAAKTT
jgi:hypothetical protein